MMKQRRLFRRLRAVAQLCRRGMHEDISKLVQLSHGDADKAFMRFGRWLRAERGLTRNEHMRDLILAGRSEYAGKYASRLYVLLQKMYPNALDEQHLQELSIVCVEESDSALSLALLGDLTKNREESMSHSLKGLIENVTVNGLLSEKERLVELLSDKSSDVNPSAMKIFLESALGRGEHGLAWNCFRSILPSRRTADMYIIMINFCGDNRDRSKLASLWIDIVDKTFKPDLNVLNSFLSAFVKVGNITKAQELLQTMQQWNVTPCATSYAVLMRAYTNGDNLKLAKQTMMEVDEANLVPSTEYFAAKIRLLAILGDFETSLTLYSQLENRNAHADPQIQRQLMFCRALAGDKDWVMGVLDRTVDGTGSDGCEAAFLFEAAVDGFARREDIAACQTIQSKLRANDMQLQPAGYKALLSCYSKAASEQEVIDLLGEMEGKPSAVYEELRSESKIRALLKVGNASEARDLFEKLSPGSSSTALLVLKLLCKTGATEQASELFQAMKTKYKMRVGVKAYEQMIKMYLMKDETEEAMVLTKEMQTLGIKRSAGILNAFVSHHSRKGNYAEARSLCNEFKDLGLKPSIYTLTLLLEAYAMNRTDEGLRSLLQAIYSQSRRPHTGLFAALLAKLRELDAGVLEVDAVLVEMEVQRVAPCKDTLMEMLHLSLNNDEMDFIVRVFSELRDKYDLKIGLLFAVSLMEVMLEKGKTKEVPAVYCALFGYQEGETGRVANYVEGLFLAYALSSDLKRAQSELQKLVSLRAKVGGEWHPKTHIILKHVRAALEEQQVTRKSEGTAPTLASSEEN